MSLQGIIATLNAFWEKNGCLIQLGVDTEVGAGTMNPETFLRVLGPDAWRVAYVQPSRRPTDGRYGDNPNRLYKHHQYQVILKPSPANVQDLYLDSLRALGIEPADHDVRFEEDNWESPALGAWGIGWQVLLDGQEITQFTYFQQAGGINLSPISAEITYGLERIAMYLQDKADIFDVEWSHQTADRPPVLYREVRHEEEFQLSRYSFELADVDLHMKLFEAALSEAARLLKLKFNEDAPQRVSLAAFGWVLHASHAFNVLDARGGISVTQRASMLLQIRKLACGVAAAYVEDRWPAPKAEPVDASGSQAKVKA
ncbi:MAG: glycine--tRNA ligase subunit alpha [Vicinamibacteria bacterium]